jgi:succinate-semialdehyde dehydrogenase/glutarate-semialdehyde dehydrogenase
MTEANYGPLEMYIDGRWIGAEGRDVHVVVNPATGQPLAELPLATKADLDEALDAAQRGFETWRKTTGDERAALMRKAAGMLRERAAKIARLLVLENGKPFGEGMWEVGFAADVLEWYAEEARRIYGRVLPTSIPNSRRMVLREPVGPVAGFAPWNVPVVLTGNKIAGALATGCSIVVKPAEETPAGILAYARVLHDAGLPPGVLNMVFGVPAAVSTHLIASPIIRKVSFTGSTAVGKQIAALAAPGLKRVTLELGGHAPTIIFDDADIDQAVEMLAGFKFFNAGQVCFAPTRFFVQEGIHDRFVEKFAARAGAVKVGSGLEDGTHMGPLANPRRLEALDALVGEAVGAGARAVLGGTRGDGPGNWYGPTILADVPHDTRIMREEPFGPVALTARFKTIDEVVQRANSLAYGLSAFVFTSSAKTAMTMTDALECGLVGINNCMVASPDAPFGGVKDSGYGFDYAHEGLEGYLTTKYVSHWGL